jgi:hypothetical protein
MEAAQEGMDFLLIHLIHPTEVAEEEMDLHPVLILGFKDQGGHQDHPDPEDHQELMGKTLLLDKEDQGTTGMILI